MKCAMCDYRETDSDRSVCEHCVPREPEHDYAFRILDASFSRKINESCFTDDTEVNHRAADELLCRALRSVGLTKIVDAFNRVKKWYS